MHEYTNLVELGTVKDQGSRITDGPRKRFWQMFTLLLGLIFGASRQASTERTRPSVGSQPSFRSVRSCVREQLCCAAPRRALPPHDISVTTTPCRTRRLSAYSSAWSTARMRPRAREKTKTRLRDENATVGTAGSSHRCRIRVCE